MAQDISGTHLATTWAADVQELTMRVEVDWSKAGSWVDETAYVKQVDLAQALYDGSLGLPMVGRGQPGRALLTLNNASGRFSVDAGIIPAIANGIYRVPLRVSAGYVDAVNGAERLRQFTGYIEEPQAGEVRGKAQVALRALDGALPLMQYKAATSLAQRQRADAWIDTVAAAAGVASRSLEAGFSELPYTWLDSENAWDDLLDVAQADAGWLFFDKEGTLRYWRMTHLLEAADSTAVQATLDRGNATEHADSLSWRNVYSGVRVEWVPRGRGEETLLYEAHEVIALRPGETREIEAAFRFPAAEVMPLQAGVDYEAVTAGMADLSASLALAVTAHAQRAELALTNNHGTHTMYVTGLQVRGVPLVAEEAQAVEVEENAGLLTGTKVYRVGGNPYLQTWEQAQRLASYLRDWLQRPRRLLQWSGAACPWLEVGDRVHIADAVHGVDTDAYVLGLSQRLAPGRWQQTVVALPVGNVYGAASYFTLGTSRWKDSGSDALAY